jgi:hypothetical protein
METAYSSETTVLTYQTARRHNAYAHAMNIILQYSHTYTKLQDVHIIIIIIIIGGVGLSP